MAEKIWQPNEVQTEFLEVLKNYPDGIALKDIELDTGKTYKTGTINTLVKKGLITTADGEYEVKLVYRDTVIGSVKKAWKKYKLATPDGNK